MAKLSEAVALWRGDTDVEADGANNPLYVAVSNEYAAAVRSLRRAGA